MAIIGKHRTVFAKAGQDYQLFSIRGSDWTINEFPTYIKPLTYAAF